MVKRNISIIVGLFLCILAVVTGCNQAPTPVAPRDGASLTFSFPIPPKPTSASLKKFGVKADAVALTYGILRYKITSGTETVSGGINFNYGLAVGTISIPLPHNGAWIVSAEWFDNGYYPVFVGADQVNVQGTTPFTLLMGDITRYGCSYDYFTDSNYCSPYADRFTFDTGFMGYSTNGDPGDIQFVYDSTNGTEFITNAGATSTSFAYLGTGEFYEFTSIPSGTVFYTDTEKAKTAVKGAGNGAMANGDVYVVQLSPTSHVWVWVWGNPSYCGSGGYVSISFRENTQGYPFMKFQETTYGLNNCMGMTYYGGGGG